VQFGNSNLASVTMSSKQAILSHNRRDVLTFHVQAQNDQTSSSRSKARRSKAKPFKARLPHADGVDAKVVYITTTVAKLSDATFTITRSRQVGLSRQRMLQRPKKSLNATERLAIWSGSATTPGFKSERTLELGIP